MKKKLFKPQILLTNTKRHEKQRILERRITTTAVDRYDSSAAQRHRVMWLRVDVVGVDVVDLCMTGASVPKRQT